QVPARPTCWRCLFPAIESCVAMAHCPDTGGGFSANARSCCESVDEYGLASGGLVQHDAPWREGGKEAMNLELFAHVAEERESIGAQAFVLRRFALPYVDELLPAIDRLAQEAPFRHMVTPGGFTMSVALTNCGALGWTTDRRGYRYTTIDPDGGRPWPPMPAIFGRLAREAA